MGLPPVQVAFVSFDCRRTRLCSLPGPAEMVKTQGRAVACQLHCAEIDFDTNPGISSRPLRIWAVIRSVSFCHQRGTCDSVQRRSTDPGISMAT